MEDNAFSFLTFVPLVPNYVLIILVIAAGSIVAFSVAKRVRGGGLRALVLAMMVLTLSGPHYQIEARKPQTDVAIVVVDETASQSIGERQKQTDQTLHLIKRDIEKSANLDLRIVHVDSQNNEGKGSQLLKALNHAAADIPINRYAGSILITDGQVHDAKDNGVLENLPDGPLHVLLSGEKQSFDRRIVIEGAPSYGLVGHSVPIRFRLEAFGGEGSNESSTVPVTYFVDGQSQGVIDVQPGVSNTLDYNIDHAGKTIIEIKVQTALGETSSLNNTGVVSLNGVRDRMRVLLVSGVPHAGERMWRNLLKSDPAVDLVHFTILRPPEKSDFTPIRELALITFPTLELFDLKIDEFDLMVFDRYVVRHVLSPRYFQNIKNYVTGGGALLVAAGPEFAGRESIFETPLGDILPLRPTGDIIEQSFRPAISETGSRHPVTARLNKAIGRDPQWGRWFRQIGTVLQGKPQVLMNGWDGQPLLALNRVGEGRIGILSSDQIWLWARGFEGGGPQDELVRRMAHWLMKEPSLEEENLKAVMEENRIRITRNSLLELPNAVTITNPDGKEIVLPLYQQGSGENMAFYTPPAPGVYRFDDGTLSTLIAVGERNPIEFHDLRSSELLLAPITEKYGGAMHWISDGLPTIRRVMLNRDTNGRGWIGLTENNAQVVTGLRDVALLPGWLAAILITSLLCGAWWREGR